MADVTMPQLGETVTEGTITKWFKQIGDQVEADEPLFEVSTDKVDTEVPSPIAGTLTEIKVNEGDTVQVGELIAVVGAAAEAEAPAAAPPAAEPEAAAPAPEAEAAPAPPPAPAGAPPPPPAEAPAATEPPPAAPAEVPAPPAADGSSRMLSPVVRRLVNEHGLRPEDIQGTGPGGRITRDDVVNHIEQSPAAPAAVEARAPAPPEAPAAAAAPPAAPAARPPAAPAVRPGQRDESVKLSKIRTITGDHMQHSLATSPHAFSVVEVDYANVDKVRNGVQDEWRDAEGFSLTFLPFISRAVIDAITDFPHLNATVGDGELVVHKFVDLGIAVDLAYQGLLVPVVRDADTKRLRALAREISDLANRAKSRRLSPDEIQGGTFTISNNGSAGSVLTAAIINQPQVAVLSTDAIKRRPVVVDLPGGQEGIAIHSVGNLAMSWDHRAFDGAYAANFLVRVKEILETRDWEAEL